MIVYPLPPRLPANPYLDLLYAPMAAEGVTIWRGRPRHALGALMAARGPRVLHLHFFDELTQGPPAPATAARSLAFLALLGAMRAGGVRLVWTAHNLAPHELRHPAWGFAAYRGAARLCHAVIAHGEAARAALERRYGPLPRVAVIPHGSYVGHYGPPRDRAASREALGLPPDGRVLLSLGALRRYKGLERLVDAFAKLPPAGRGTLLLAGEAREPAYAAALKARAAAVAGVLVRDTFVPDAELPGYLAAADAVVLPYRELLTSGALLLALSYARPVIAPALPPVRELVADGRAGLLYAPDDPDGLRGALARALGHPDLDALGRAGLELASGLSWPAIARRTLELYREVAGL